MEMCDGEPPYLDETPMKVLSVLNLCLKLRCQVSCVSAFPVHELFREFIVVGIVVDFHKRNARSKTS